MPVTLFAEDKAQESVLQNGHSIEDIKKGQRYFMGLLPRNSENPSCVSCHNIKQVDTLNWNPSALEIALKYSSKSDEEFQSAITQPYGILLEQVHQGFDLGEDELKLVKLYLDDLTHTGLPEPKLSISRLMLFLFLGVVMALLLLDLFFFKKVKPRFIHVILLVGALGWQLNIVVKDAIRLGRQENYAPDQPIKFSHKVHVGENKIDCMYCHTTVEHSKSAGIPAANLCMNCHILIREGTNSGKFEIAKVVDANENGIPIEWLRTHNLPDHVFFSHAVHVGSGKLDCATCHGPVEEMDILRQHSDLSMGWCVNCHRDTEVQFEENGYYDSYIKLHEELKAGKIDTIRAEDIGANDCMKCHY